jgi:hypothetical protein
MPRVGFESATPVLERKMIIRALDRPTTLTDNNF